MAVSSKNPKSGANPSKQPGQEQIRRRVTRKLPKGFEKTIIELELQLEKGQATKELIAMLLSLYSVGVEHYDSIGDLKNATMYREKIQLLFNKPIVIQTYMLMVKKASNHQDESSNQQPTIRVNSRISTPKYKQNRQKVPCLSLILLQSKSDSEIRKHVEVMAQQKQGKEIEIEVISSDSPMRVDTLENIESLMDRFLQQKKESQVMLIQEQQQQHEMLKIRLMQRNQSRQASRSRLLQESRSTNQMSNQQSINLTNINDELALKLSGIHRPVYFNQDQDFNISKRLSSSHSIEDLKFTDFMDEINYIKDQTYQNQSLQEIHTSIILQDSGSSKVSEILSPQTQHQPKILSDDGEVISFKGSSKSQQMCSDDIEIENSDEYKLAEILAIGSFVEKRNFELSSINDKYEQQLQSLKQRGQNRKFLGVCDNFTALTKKLIEKLHAEWNESLSKREQELEEEKVRMLQQLSVDFKARQLFSDDRQSEDYSLSRLQNQHIEVSIQDQYISSNASSPFKIIDQNDCRQ